MQEFKVGQIVQSIQGHDKGQLYTVVDVLKDRVLICDGEFKLLDKPKSKNMIHIKGHNYIDSEIATKIKNGLKINDQMIYHSIVKFKKLVKENMYGK